MDRAAAARPLILRCNADAMSCIPGRKQSFTDPKYMVDSRALTIRQADWLAFDQSRFEISRAGTRAAARRSVVPDFSALILQNQFEHNHHRFDCMRRTT